MKILLDMQACQAPLSRNRGIGRYSLSLALALVSGHRHHEFWLLLNGAYPDSATVLRKQFSQWISPDQMVDFFPVEGANEVGTNDDWCARVAEELRMAAIKRIAPDAVHVSSLFEGASDNCAVSVGADGPVTAVTLYDLIPLLNEQRYLSNPSVRKWYHRKILSLARADVLLGISESASQEACKSPLLSQTPVVTISSAVDRAVFHPAPLPPDANQMLMAIGIRGRFVMYTGGIDWRKNIEGLIRAYAQLPGTLRASRQLALVCHAEESAKRDLYKLALSAGLTDGEVILTGFVSDEMLTLLYRSCELFVFPSLHEGFGLPALEAMCCGAPVVGSDRNSILEVIGLPEAMFDPTSEIDMARVMGLALTDEAFREELLLNGRTQADKFSWDLTARRAIDALEAAYVRRGAGESSRSAQVRALSRPNSTGRPTLAMVTPMLPARSGIADYCSELLPVLREYYDITAICDPIEDVAWDDGQTPVPVRSVEWFKQNADSFERIVYQFGNSEFHAHMFGLLREYPGVVVLHDFYLSGVLSWMERTAYSAEAFSRALGRSHGQKAMVYLKRHGPWKAQDAYPCNRFVLERARGVIVHSRFSINAAEQWYGQRLTTRWAYIPHLRVMPHQIERDAARAALGLVDDDFVVCTFGFIAPSKLNERLLAAWSQSSLARDPNCKLVLVGHNEPDLYGRAIDKLLARMPLKGQVSITGFADRSLFETYLSAGDLAVQLRAHSRGETSGAVLDCLAHGLPVILNANGPMAEYPDDAVCKLTDEFSEQDLVQALERLRADHKARQEFATRGRLLIQEHHHPAEIASRYREAIESFFVEGASGDGYWKMLKQLAQRVGHGSEGHMVQAVLAIQKNRNCG